MKWIVHILASLLYVISLNNFSYHLHDLNIFSTNYAWCIVILFLLILQFYVVLFRRLSMFHHPIPLDCGSFREENNWRTWLRRYFAAGRKLMFCLSIWSYSDIEFRSFVSIKVQGARDEMQWGEEGPPPLLVKIAPDLSKEDLEDIAAVCITLCFVTHTHSHIHTHIHFRIQNSYTFFAVFVGFSCSSLGWIGIFFPQT